MKRLAHLLGTALIAGVVISTAPATAHAAAAPEEGCQYSETYVRGLEIDLIEATHEAYTLRATLEEERDEHADDLRHLDRVAWETVQAHNAEMNTYITLAHNAQDALLKNQQETRDGNVARDLRISRLQDKVRELRAKLDRRR